MDKLKFNNECSGVADGAFIAITRNCNTYCNHCYTDAGPGKPDMPIPLAKKAIGLFIDNRYSDNPNCSPIIRLSGGEPLIHANLFDILEFGRGLHQRIRYHFLSNGIVLPSSDGKALCKELRAMGTDLITVCGDQFHPKVDIDSITREKTRAYPEIFSRGSYKLMMVHAIGRGINLNDIWNTSPRFSCDEFCNPGYYRRTDRDGDRINVIPFNVDWDGVLRYCPLFAGDLGTVEDSMETITDNFINDPIIKLIWNYEQEGLPKVLKIASEITSKYDHLPKNCAGCHAVTRDKEVREEIQKRLKTEVNS